MRLLLITLLLLFTTTANAQLTSNKWHISGKYSYGAIGTARYNNFSLGAEYMPTDRLGLTYNFDFLFRNDDYFHFHTSIGALAGPPLIVIGALATLSDGDDWDNDDFNLGPLGILLGIAVLIAPDGISYHIPLSYKWDLAPYANVLGVDVVRNRDIDKTYFKYAMSFGTKATYMLNDRATLSLFVETRKVAGFNWGLGGGFGLGYAFAPRHQDFEAPLN